MTEIRLEHVSYAYDDEKILEDLRPQWCRKDYSL